MDLNEASGLLEQGEIKYSERKIWIELGCGTGVFTRSLAQMLGPFNLFYALDADQEALASVPEKHHMVIIKKHHCNFIADPWPVSKVDGILMANSLHYVKDKEIFLGKALSHLIAEGIFLIVEYDTDTPRAPWVPYPVSFNSLKILFEKVGNFTISKLHERSSIYNRSKIYSALIMS